MISDIDDKKIEVDLKKYLFSENGLHQIHPIKKEKKMEKVFDLFFISDPIQSSCIMCRD